MKHWELVDLSIPVPFILLAIYLSYAKKNVQSPKAQKSRALIDNSSL